MPNSNELYLVVQPLIHLSNVPYIGFGLVEQVLTLLPTKEFATEFFEDEVDGYVTTFQNRQQHITGGHVTGWDLQKIKMDNGRFIVKVTQHVG